MSLRTEDIAVIRELEDQLISELDRQYMDGEIEDGSEDSAYFDPMTGQVSGIPDWFKALTVVMQHFWEENGR